MQTSLTQPLKVELTVHKYTLTKCLAEDYGRAIDAYLKRLEKKTALKADHLAGHECIPAFRSKMVDWMCEVINIAFKNNCSDQTFFLAVSILDRYI